MKKIYTILCCIFFSSVTSNAQPSFIKDSLDAYIQQGLKDWNIPGLAIAIVHEGNIVFMKGYGVKDIESKEPVNENTLFMIASNSKLFTGTALAMLDYDKKLSLDDKIIKYYPDFKLYDNNATKLVTIKDMLGHHLGTKTFQGDFTFWNSTLSRSEITKRMHFLKPSNEFRASYGYCNSCFLTAGEIIPKVTGKPWEVFIYDSLVKPLDMIHTSVLGMNMSSMNNVAKPYSNSFTGELNLLPYDQIDNMAPATSMVSCVNDLSKWLLMQLDSGKYLGKQIIPWQVVRKTRDMITTISSRKNKNTHFTGYGLGVFMSDYNGKQLFNHTGGADGFVSNTCFIPEEKLGITILTNNDNQNFFEVLRLQIIDAYLGIPYVNRSKQQIAGFKKDEDETLSKIEGWKSRIKDTAAPLPMNEYAGVYENNLYGTLTISPQQNKLFIKFNSHKNLTATMQYMDNGEWMITYNPIAYGIFSTKFLTENNKVKSIDIKVSDFIEYDPYTFTKKMN